MSETDDLRRIISDPGAIIPRGDDFTEPIPQWSARAVLASGWVSPEEAAALRARIARVEALADEWVDEAGAELAEALAEPERDEESGR